MIDENGSPIKAPENVTTTEQLIRDLTLDLEDDEDRLMALQNEQLPGSCKSQYALQFALKTEKANADFMQRKIEVREKKMTKGRFPIPYQTNAGVWMNDRSWKKTANPNSWNKETHMENTDIAMLEKRKKQKML